MLISDPLREGRTAAAVISLDELIPNDHIIRKIDAAIDWEACCAPLRAYYNAERGRPAFEPDILLAIALLRHINNLDSLRAAASEMQTNLVYRWFIGCPLHEPVPHFSTISSNMLHRLPAALFDEAFAAALTHIIDAGVLSAEDLVYPSAFLKKDGFYEKLCGRYFMAVDQLTFTVPEVRKTESIGTGQIRFGE